MLSQYDFACCNLKIDVILTIFDYKSSNSIIRMVVISWFVCKDKINIKYDTGHCGLHCNELSLDFKNSQEIRNKNNRHLCHWF